MTNEDRKLAAVIEVAALALGTDNIRAEWATHPMGALGTFRVLRIFADGRKDAAFALASGPDSDSRMRVLDVMLRSLVCLHAAPAVKERGNVAIDLTERTGRVYQA